MARKLKISNIQNFKIQYLWFYYSYTAQFVLKLFACSTRWYIKILFDKIIWGLNGGMNSPIFMKLWIPRMKNISWNFAETTLRTTIKISIHFGVVLHYTVYTFSALHGRMKLFFIFFFSLKSFQQSYIYSIFINSWGTLKLTIGQILTRLFFQVAFWISLFFFACQSAASCPISASKNRN